MLRDAARTQSEDEGTVSFTFSLQVQGRLESYWERKGGARPAYMNRPAVGNGGEAVAAAGAEGAKGGEARDPKKGWLHLPAKRVEEAGGSGSDGEEEEEAAASGSEYEDASEDDECRTIQKRSRSEAEEEGRRVRVVGEGGHCCWPRCREWAGAWPRYFLLPLSCPSLLPPCCSPLPRHRSDQAASTTLPLAAAQVQGKLKPIDEGGGSGSGGGGGKENGVSANTRIRTPPSLTRTHLLSPSHTHTPTHPSHTHTSSLTHTGTRQQEAAHYAAALQAAGRPSALQEARPRSFSSTGRVQEARASRRRSSKRSTEAAAGGRSGVEGGGQAQGGRRFGGGGRGGWRGR